MHSRHAFPGTHNRGTLLRACTPGTSRALRAHTVGTHLGHSWGTHSTHAWHIGVADVGRSSPGPRRRVSSQRSAPVGGILVGIRAMMGGFEAGKLSRSAFSKCVLRESAPSAPRLCARSACLESVPGVLVRSMRPECITPMFWSGGPRRPNWASTLAVAFGSRLMLRS